MNRPEKKASEIYLDIYIIKFFRILGWIILGSIILGWFWCPAFADTLPIDGCTTLSGWYYEQRVDNATGKTYIHGALDFPANEYTPFRACRSGIVIHAVKKVKDHRGKFIEILYEDGTSGLYMHCATVDVVKGQKITEGQFIGSVGNTGRSFGPHLHYQVNDADDMPIFVTKRFNVPFKIHKKRLQ